MKKLFNTLFLLFGLSVTLYCQTSSKSILMINSYESHDKGYSKIIVTENDKKIEEIGLEAFTAKNFDTNQIEINKVLNKYINLGYKLITSIRGSAPTNNPNATFLAVPLVTTYLFEK